MKNTLELIRWAWHHCSGIRANIAWCCVLGAIRVALSLAFVWVSKNLVDTATMGDAPVGRMISQSVCLVALLLSEMGISLVVQYLTNKSEVKMKNHMRSQIYEHLMHSEWASHHMMHSGDLLNRLTEDVRMVTDVVCVRLQQVLLMVLQFIGAFFFLAYLSWQLALCVVAIMPLFVLLSKVYISKTRSITAEIRQGDSGVQTTMQEGIQHHVVVQTLECEGRMMENISLQQDRLYAKTMERTRFSVFSRGMVQTGFIGCFLLAFLWSVWHLYHGTITFGTMTAFLQLVSRVQNPVVNLSHHIPSFVQAMTSIDRLSEVERIPSEHRASPIVLSSPIGIRISNLSFSYKESGKEIFHDFSYDFIPGSKTVIMGETGVGKSTLIRLLLALLRPDKGEIVLYDAHRSVKASEDTRVNMVYVPQGNSLLQGTIRDNLLLVDPDASEARMREVLHIAVADFVFGLPAGLDTPCGELGSGLSEGQAQRIAIARALLRRGAILLLDEFNSSLDEATATTLMHRLIKSRAENTILFISHRKDVVSYCDAVLHIDHK